MKTIELVVDNIKCDGCTTTIVRQLLKIDGVNEVNVDISHGKITINYEGADKKEKFVSTLTRLGYPQKGTTNSIQKVKSYISCAIGKMSKE